MAESDHTQLMDSKKKCHICCGFRFRRSSECVTARPTRPRGTTGGQASTLTVCGVDGGPEAGREGSDGWGYGMAADVNVNGLG